MTVIIISIVAAWILFSALLVVCACIRSGQINKMMEEHEENLDQD